MEDVLGILCFMTFMAVLIGLPVSALVGALKLYADVRSLTLRVGDLEGLRTQQKRHAFAAPSPEPLAPTPEAPQRRAEPELTEADAAEPADGVDAAPDALAGVDEPVAEPLPDGESGSEAPATVDDLLGVDDGDEAPRAAARSFTPSPERIAVWLGAGLGGLSLLVGGILGLVAVAQSGWFGPAARISFGFVAGTALWVAGALLRGRLVAVPSALAGVGMGVLYGALFAAHSFYGLIGPMPTFAGLVAVSGLAGLRAMVLSDRFMAYLGLIGGLLAPIAVSTGQNGAVGLFAFLTLLSVGTLAAAARNRWPDLVAACLFGTTALYVGWTATWLAPDSVPVALVAALVLSVPYAVVAMRSAGDRPVDHATWIVGALGSGVWMLLAVPWLVPLDASFMDPRSFLLVTQPVGATRWWGAVALSLLPLPGWLAARSRGSALHSAAISAAGLLLTLSWTGGWTQTLDGADALALFASLGPLVLGVLVHLGARRTGTGLVLHLFGWLAAWSAGLVTGVDPALLGGSFTLVVVVALAASRVSSTSPMLLGLLGTTAVGLLAQAALPDTPPLWLGGQLLLVLGSLPLVALSSRWRGDRLMLGWLAGALTAAALFPAAYDAWETNLGTTVIGLVPLALGLHALLVTAVLTRYHRLRLDHPVVLLAIAIVLGGVTFALPVQVQEQWLTVGWALEAVALAWMGRFGLRHPLVRWASVFLSLAVSFRLLANPYALAYGTASGWPVLNWTLYTWGVPTVALIATAKGLEAGETDATRDGLTGAPQFLRLLAMATGFALINVEVSHAFQDAGPVELGGATMLQGMVRSLAWSAYGLGLLVLGLFTGSRTTRFVGFAFLLLAAAKVSVYDLWTMPGFVRVGSLIGLGFTLIVAAVLFNRLVLREPSNAGES